MRGPYEYLESGKRVPRYFEIDSRACTTMDELKQAVMRLPPNSVLKWTGGCSPYDEIELGQRPYMSLHEFQRFCAEHKVRFIWYFGI